MEATRVEIARHLDDPAWLRAFAGQYLRRLFRRIERRSSYWKSDRESQAPEEEVDYFPERGIVLWTCEHEGGGPFRWREVALLESGTLCFLQRSEQSGVVRADFEAYAQFREREADMQGPLSPEDLEIHHARITEEVLRRASEEEEKAHHQDQS